MSASGDELRQEGEGGGHACVSDMSEDRRGDGRDQEDDGDDFPAHRGLTPSSRGALARLDPAALKLIPERSPIAHGVATSPLTFTTLPWVT